MQQGGGLASSWWGSSQRVDQLLLALGIGQTIDAPRCFLRYLSYAPLAIYNRFSNLREWSFSRPDGKICNIKTGPMLSDSKLVDNEKYRDELFSDHPTAVGGEMESVGLWSAAKRRNTEWILVKSVCDWADGKKHKQHQPLAAKAAATAIHSVLDTGNALDDVERPKMPFTPSRSSRSLMAGLLLPVVTTLIVAGTVGRAPTGRPAPANDPGFVVTIRGNECVARNQSPTRRLMRSAEMFQAAVTINVETGANGGNGDGFGGKIASAQNVPYLSEVRGGLSQELVRDEVCNDQLSEIAALCPLRKDCVQSLICTVVVVWDGDPQAVTRRDYAYRWVDTPCEPHPLNERLFRQLDQDGNVTSETWPDPRIKRMVEHLKQMEANIELLRRLPRSGSF